MQGPPGENQHSLPRKGKGRRVRSLGPVLMTLILLGMGFMIAREEVPAMRDFLDSLIDPSAHRAVVACREAALAASSSPAFAVVVRGGEAQSTPGGYVVRNLVIGEMVPGEGEVQVAHTCHVDRSGKLVQLHRSPRPTR